MSKKDRKKEKISLEDGAKGFSHNPFAQLWGASKDAASGHMETPTSGEDTGPAAPLKLNEIRKVVLRRERKGRGGKTVTLIEGLEGFDAPSLDELARQARKSLGCGAAVEEGIIVVQGDQRDRLETWLQSQGVKKIVHSG